MTWVVKCPCKCGENVKFAKFDFKDTEITIEACSKMKAQGIVSYQVPKSTLLQWNEEGFSLNPSEVKI